VTTFQKTEPDKLPFEALKFLENALNKTPSNDEELWETLKTGEIYVISREKIVGCIHLEFHPDLMNIVLLGGENIKYWRDDLYKFCIDLIKSRGIHHICILGRHGWGSIFKELTPIGMIYHLEEGGYVAEA